MVRRPSERYGSFPTTADVGLWARGTTAGELFSAAGVGLFALMTDLRRVRAKDERTVVASADDAEGLVVAYLTELLLLEETEGFLGRRIHARPVGSPPTSILATIRGEIFDPSRHRRRKEVKAITYHRLLLDLKRGRLRVIVDI